MTDDSHSLIPIPDASLANTGAGAERILSAMVGDTLALGREEALALTARFRIGDYIWCEPDYRQILLWAEALKMEPLTVIEKLVAGEDSEVGATRFQDGRMLSLSWNLDELPLWDLGGGEGLTVQKLLIYNSESGDLDEEDPPKITLCLPSLRTLNCCWKKIDSTTILTGVPNLTILNCGFNLTELNLSHVSSLTELGCSNNQLTELDLSGVPNLTVLRCGGNSITELDLAPVPNLAVLSCNGQYLMELNLSHVPNLTNLRCDGNLIKELELSHVPNLTNLDCDENQITKLDTSCVPCLTELWCCGNQLTELDLSRVPNLTVLTCDDNRLTELDLSHVRKLAYLYCSGNQLTELDIRPLLSLEKLDYDTDRTRLIQRPDQNF